MVGLSAVLAVQTQAKAEVTRALAGERHANRRWPRPTPSWPARKPRCRRGTTWRWRPSRRSTPASARTSCSSRTSSRSCATGCLRSASDFYGKLWRLLGKETDLASRRALWQSNFELADLTAKVGRKEDALAAHRQVLAAREALAAEAGGRRRATVDVGRSLTAVASFSKRRARRTRRWRRTGESESLLAGPAGSDAAARAAMADCRSKLGGLLPEHGQVRRGRSGLSAGAGRPGGTGRRHRGPGRGPARPGGHGHAASAS